MFVLQAAQHRNSPDPGDLIYKNALWNMGIQSHRVQYMIEIVDLPELTPAAWEAQWIAGMRQARPNYGGDWKHDAAMARIAVEREIIRLRREERRLARQQEGATVL